MEGDRYILKLGDAREWLPKMPAASVDALVCDPPAGISFMGKEWDHDHGHRDEWVKAFASIFVECLRVMKPGAHGLVWALPRTSHWTATALEDAGFEVRDIVMHLFGSGFPKSLNVSKAIDDAAGAVRAVVGEKEVTRVLNSEDVKVHNYGTGMVGKAGTIPITAPTTTKAIKFDGWGTALKPAAEHWILVRKPLEGTVAANVVAHGTGGLNIDASRIGTEKRHPGKYDDGGAVGGNRTTGNFAGSDRSEFDAATGRWPANVTLDEEAAAMLDAQSGALLDRGNKGPSTALSIESVAMGAMTPRGSGAEFNHVNASKGASRFFYVAKASRKERDAGCDDLSPRSGGEATDRTDGSAGLQSPRAGAGRGGGARNHHPTVKSVSLMEYLIKLITPPDGLVLDPFMGSGSTGVAAIRAGFTFAGIEREAEYVEIARRRIAHAEEKKSCP
jgi:site-specific DNA-methyltransferase (adenine-specific)